MRTRYLNPKYHALFLTAEELELVYGMLTQRLYCRTRDDDPQRDMVSAIRDEIMQFDHHWREEL